MSKALKKTLLLLTLLSTGLEAHASSFGDEARAAVSLYSAKEQIDTKRADPRLFGLRLERHGNQTKASILSGTSNAIETYDFSCETADSTSFCQSLGFQSSLPYQREGFLYSGDFLTDALDAITEYLKVRGVATENVSLFKIWHAVGGLQARVGFEAGLVEVAFVCDPRDAVFCRPADAELRNEP